MGVLIQPRGVSGRFVVLTHPRTGVPVYALPSGGEMWVLEQLGAGGRSWFLGGRDEVACGALSMLVKADAMFFLLRTVPTRLFLPLDDISDLPAPLALPALARCCDSQRKSHPPMAQHRTHASPSSCRRNHHLPTQHSAPLRCARRQTHPPRERRHVR